MALLPLLLLPMALAPLALGVLLAAATGFHVPGPVLAGAIRAVAALTLAGLASPPPGDELGLFLKPVGPPVMVPRCVL